MVIVIQLGLDFKMSMQKARFLALMRKFAQNTRFGTRHIRHDVTQDERTDLTLVAFRVYGDREEWLAIQGAAGLDTPENPLESQTLILPSVEDLQALKRQAGL